MASGKTILKVIGFGLLLWVVICVAQVVLTMFTGTYDSIDCWWGNAVVGGIVAGFAWLFADSLRPIRRTDAIFFGVIWVVMLYAIGLLLVLPNTWESMFGQWSVHFVYLGAFVGTLFVKTALR